MHTTPLDAKEKEGLRQGMRIVRLVWATMVMSLGIYVLVCYRVAGRIACRKAAETLPTLRTALFGLAAVVLFAIPRLRRHILTTGAGAARRSAGRVAPGAPSHPAAARYLAATVASLALAESIGIFGVVLFFIGADSATLYLFMAVSAAAMILYRPKAEELERVAAKMKADPAAARVEP